MIAAGVDIGTNTCLMVVAHVSTDGTVEVLEDLQHIPRLGRGVDSSGAIAQESIKRTSDVLRMYRQVLDRHGDPPVVCVGTSALRDAKNRNEVVDVLSNALQVDVSVIDGATEARLTFLGATSSLGPKELVIDVGGGSTEYAVGDGGRLLNNRSVNIGSVRLSERWCRDHPVSKTDRLGLIEDIRNEILTVLGDQINNFKVSAIAVAGTATSLAMMELGATTFVRDTIEGFILKKSSVDRITSELLSMSMEQLHSLPGIASSRADILPAGAAILNESMGLLELPEVRVSTHGIRYGALLMAAGVV